MMEKLVLFLLMIKVNKLKINLNNVFMLNCDEADL